MPKPDAETWQRFSLIARDDEGAIVEAEFIRPAWWFEKNGIVAGALMPLAIEELKLSGMATIKSVEECGPIALGGGSVVTGRFTTNRVDVIVRLTVAAADGTTEVLDGTTVHPVWSIDRHDWVQLSELQSGERLQADDGHAIVISVAIVPTTVPVYNIEVHGEHVYQVGEFWLLAHNACEGIYVFTTTTGKSYVGQTASTGFCVIRPKIESLNANYLFHWVKTLAFIDQMVRKSTGASRLLGLARFSLAISAQRSSSQVLASQRLEAWINRDANEPLREYRHDGYLTVFCKYSNGAVLECIWAANRALLFHNHTAAVPLANPTVERPKRETLHSHHVSR